MKTLLSLIVLFLTTPSFAQDTLRIATYNVLNYPGIDAAQRNPYFRATMVTMNPDVLVVQEMESQTGVNTFLNDVLNVYRPGMYSSVTFNNGPDTDNAFFYKPSEVTFIRANYIPTALRNVAEYLFKVNGQNDTLRIFSLHLKANIEDSIARLNEATIVRSYLNDLPPGAKFIVAGDFNLYRSSEPAFQKLIGSETNNNGRCKDPLNAVGIWNNNFAFRSIHTQSPRVRSFGNGSTGGLDDRFDMLLISFSLEQSLITSSYKAYGNDGNHFNDSINRLPNAAVPDSIANALHYASDHLPVYADFVFEGVTGMDTVSTEIFGFKLQNYPNPFNSSTTISFSIPQDSRTSLIVFDALGRHVSSVDFGQMAQGVYRHVFDATGLSSGIYFYRILAGGNSATNTMLLVK